MNPLLKDREVAFYLGDSDAKVLLAWHQFADAAHLGAEQTSADCVLVEPGEFEDLLARCDPDQESAPREPDDTAVILYTSGTTGKPKGAELTHSNLLRNVEVTIDLFDLDERAVAPTPPTRWGRRSSPRYDAPRASRPQPSRAHERRQAPVQAPVA
jgi:long-chain acyl-CoA synthetase